MLGTLLIPAFSNFRMPHTRVVDSPRPMEEMVRGLYVERNDQPCRIYSHQLAGIYTLAVYIYVYIYKNYIYIDVQLIVEANFSTTRGYIKVSSVVATTRHDVP